MKPTAIAEALRILVIANQPVFIWGLQAAVSRP